MKKMTVNGREITTNYGQQYPVVKGNDKKGYRMRSMQWILEEGAKYRCLEGDRRMLERLADEGWTTIYFAEVTTCVRGYHNVFAYVK